MALHFLVHPNSKALGFAGCCPGHILGPTDSLREKGEPSGGSLSHWRNSKFLRDQGSLGVGVLPYKQSGQVRSKAKRQGIETISKIFKVVGKFTQLLFAPLDVHVRRDSNRVGWDG